MEYAITIGEGLLLEYGYLEDDDLMADVILGIPEGSTIIVFTVRAPAWDSLAYMSKQK